MKKSLQNETYPLFIVWTGYEENDEHVFSSKFEAQEFYLKSKSSNKCIMQHDSYDATPIRLLGEGEL